MKTLIEQFPDNERTIEVLRFGEVLDCSEWLS